MYWGIFVLLILLNGLNGFFVSLNRASKRPYNLEMSIFDFIKDRTEEGLAQVQNIASKTLEGKLGEALLDSAEYIKLRNKIDAENFKKLTSGLSKSRELLLGGISGAFDSKMDRSLDERLAQLEDVLLQADIGASTSAVIIEDLKQYAKTSKVEAADILPVLRTRLIEALTPPEGSGGINFSPSAHEPTVIFVIGANGMGKTTTIGKLAGRLRKEANQTVVLGACDTFRAAAVEQLGEWAQRANVSIVKPEVGETDPVPVVKRTIRQGIQGGADVIIIDTSGRLSNNFELIQQLQDMKAAIQAELPNHGAPHETLLVVDGSVGRNAVEQAAAWRKYVGVSGLAITKLDGTARGGFVVSVVQDQQLPIKLIGVGEGIADLRDFDATQFVDALLGVDPSRTDEVKARAGKILGLESSESTGGNKAGNGESWRSGGGGVDDAASRLREAFSQSSQGRGSDEMGPLELQSSFLTDVKGAGTDGAATGKPKRLRRTKPPLSRRKAKKEKKEKKAKKEKK